MDPSKATAGRIRPAPENTITPEEAGRARRARRGFMAKALAMGAGASAAGAVRAADGDPAILKLPIHTTTLGQPVAARGYGVPSVWEKNLQRRESPGLTRVSAASVSFTPLQGLFGIITPNGLHFERHHQGWYDVDPSGHRLMVMGMVKAPRVFTMDDLMRLPAVSRIHFIECGANTGMEWGNVAVPTVQYSHGMLSCCEYTGVRLSTLLDMVGADTGKGRYVLAEGADGSSMTRTISMESGAGRRDGRLGHERRDAAAGERIPAAAGGARCAGRLLGQVPAPHRSRRPAVSTPRTRWSTTST